MSQSLSLNRVYTLCKPEGDFQTPLLFDSPHSGQKYPEDFDYICKKSELESLSDLYVDELFEHVTQQAAYFLKAEFPRSYIDVNRHIDDIDIQLVDGLWSKAIYKQGRAKSGYGVIYRLAKGKNIYETRLSAETIHSRLTDYYTPYHKALSNTLNTIHERYGTAYHINCHSMPSSQRFIKLPDIVLSDRNGSSCSPQFMDFVKTLFVRKGYSISVNHPYKGAEILRQCGNPAYDRHSLQIEINRKLYMDEKTLQKHEGFEALKGNLEDITLSISKALRDMSENLLAAD